MLLFYRAECLLLANTRAVYFTFTFIMGNGDATRTLNISAPTHILAVAVAWNMEKFYIMHLDNFEIYKYLPHRVLDSYFIFGLHQLVSLERL